MWVQKEITLKPRSRGFHLVTNEEEKGQTTATSRPSARSQSATTNQFVWLIFGSFEE